MNVRPSSIAGRWYPDNPTTLTQTLNRYLDQAPTKPPSGRAWGIVVPHAGYRYSGLVAAHAFNSLVGLRFDTVAVVSPLHHRHRAPLLTTAYDAYRTPLGQVRVDKAALNRLSKALADRLGYGLTDLSHDQEHALEIELPFLQRTIGEFRLVPVMMRKQDKPVANALGQALAETLRNQNVLFVASSDLSHFYSQQTACELDEELLRRLEAFDPDGVLDAEDEGLGFACGRGAIAAVLWAAQQLGGNRVSILCHATSGDVSGDFRSVVGYGAALIWQTQEPAAPSRGLSEG